MKTLDIKILLQIILKKWWIIAIAALMFSGSTYGACLYLVEPVYQSNTTIYITKGSYYAQKSDEYMDLLIGSTLITDYRELAKSRLVISQVLNDLELEDMSVDTLSDKVSVDLRNNTRVIQISAIDSSPMMAKKIADKFTDVFIEKVVYIMQAVNAKVIDRAEIPVRPIKPSKMKYTAAAFVAGFIFGFVIVFLIEFFDNTVRTADDVKGLLNLPVIGMIPVFTNKLKGGRRFA